MSRSVVTPDGTVLKPDPDSPFTRSRSGIRIPEDVSRVTIRAHDTVDGWGGKTVTVDLSKRSGAGFEAER